MYVCGVFSWDYPWCLIYSAINGISDHPNYWCIILFYIALINVRFWSNRSLYLQNDVVSMFLRTSDVELWRFLEESFEAFFDILCCEFYWVCGHCTVDDGGLGLESAGSCSKSFFCLDRTRGELRVHHRVADGADVALWSHFIWGARRLGSGHREPDPGQPAVLWEQQEQGEQVKICFSK